MLEMEVKLKFRVMVMVPMEINCRLNEDDGMMARTGGVIEEVRAVMGGYGEYY